MINRRAFASGLGLLLPALALDAASVSAQESPSPLPPAFLQLRDCSAEAQPISLTEREHRYERAQRRMHDSGLDAIVLAGGSSLVYFTGIHWRNSERLFVCVLPRSGAPFYVAPTFEEERARNLMQNAPGGQFSRVYTWQENEDPYALVPKGLGDLGIRSGKLGIEERVPFVFSDGIRSAAPAFTLASATPVTAGCRAVKSPAELALMQLANNVTLAVYRAAWQSITPGVTNRQVTAWISAGYQRSGFPGEASCQVDAYSALPHGSPQPPPIHEGSVVLLDDGCIVQGYQSDISRTFVLGKATDRMKQVFDIVHRAQSAALAAARPGVPCGSVDAAARKVITDSGFGPGYAHFTHRVGHGIGLDMHEWPYLVQGNPLPLQANMTFSDEPGIYLRGDFGVRLEDDMHITPDGARLFTPQSASIEQPFG